MFRIPALALAALFVGTAFVPVLPLASADTVTQTWTQDSQIDFSQGSGSADVTSSPGHVLPGHGVPNDPGQWTLDQDGGCSWGCLQRSYQGSPYVTSGQGSMYLGRQECCSSGFTITDLLSHAAPAKSTLTLYVYASPSYYAYAWYSAYEEQDVILNDGSNTQTTMLDQVNANCCWGYSLNWGPYAAYEVHNGWGWYRFDINVPSFFNLATLRVQVRNTLYAGSCWSSCNIYLFNTIAFQTPLTSEFDSNVHDAGGVADWGDAHIDGFVPTGATMKVQTRSSLDGSTFSDWSSVLSGEPVASPPGRYIQYRVLFDRGTSTSDPYLSSMSIDERFTVDTTPPVSVAQVYGDQGCAGWYVSPPVVKITATDDLSGVAATYDSLDQGVFQVYQGPFAVGDGVHTLDYYSVDGAGNVEAVKHLSFKADTQPPTTALAIGAPAFQGDQLYVAPGTTFTLSASDATSGVKTTTVDTGSGPAAYAGAFQLGGPDGARTVSFHSEDNACNAEPASTVGAFVDGTPPTVQLTSPGTSGFTALGHSSSDVAPYGQAVQQLNQLGLYGSDVDTLAGIVHEGASEACGPVLADKCAALALLDLAPGLGGPVVVGSLDVTAQAADPVVDGGASGLAQVGFFVDGALQAAETQAPFRWTWDAANASLGHHTLSVVAVDHLGNAASDSRTVSVVPVGEVGLLASGSAVLKAAAAPQFAQDLYTFLAAKVQAAPQPALPPPPSPPGSPQQALDEVNQTVQALLGKLPQPPPPGPVCLPSGTCVMPPDANAVAQQVEQAVAGLPVPVPQPPGLPDAGQLQGMVQQLLAKAPPAPPLPQVCVGSTCVPP